MKIYAPVKDATGTWASVRFVKGVGETDDPKLIEWFKAHGYKVPIETNSVEPEVNPVETVENDQLEEVKNENPVFNPNPDESEFVEINKLADESVEQNAPNFDEMSIEDIRTWAKANGLGWQVRNTRNREKLLEVVKANRG